jgi:predicted nucleic acid-binding Zn ribbon protein
MKRKTAFSASSNVGIARLGDVLPQLIAKYGLQQRKNIKKIEQAWRKTVGEPFGSVTRIIGLKRGTLEIAVPHNAFVQELSFRLAELLASVQADVAEEKIKKIKFTVQGK